MENTGWETEREGDLCSVLPYKTQLKTSLTSSSNTKEPFKCMQIAFQVGQPLGRPTKIKYTQMAFQEGQPLDRPPKKISPKPRSLGLQGL